MFKRLGLLTILLCFNFLWISCSSNDPKKPIHQVKCRYWLQQCHLKARNYCPAGYQVVRSTRLDKVGGPQGTYKEFKMMITCN